MKTERDLFLEALELGTPEARAAYLQGACGQDVALRRKVDALLKEHFSNDSLLAGPALEGEPSTVTGFIAEEAPARMIGRYKLLERIGEGGFGEVWMAEQREPVKRRVALKLIKPGMDSRQIVARFEAERQALAMMDHPNIAKILDAGTTANLRPASGRPLAPDGSGVGGEGGSCIGAGRPYFVMELVRGIKVTEYCDQNQLPTQERLRLFILVCQAIQHAHQKGIIHRDIKPSNILVTLHDGVPVPKVIDFGIAKATQQELTEKTVFTQFQQFIGTPAYISPEQAEMSGLDIDTRADIYSLGVLLYELLVGQTPFDAKEMMRGGLDALRQVIREKEPLRPSTKLNTLPGDVRTTAGKRRQTDVARLVHQLQGDLDWIVMKCLEKDRTRRYDTANGLAADIQRHLANEPVTARPPSAAYKLQKAWRRNKLAWSAAGAVMCAMVLGVVASTWQAVRATKAETAQKEVAERARADRDAVVAAKEGEDRAREQLRQLLYTSDMERAQHAWEQNNVGFVLQLLERHRDRKRPGDFEWYYLWRLCRPSLLTPKIETGSPALAVALSADGTTLACGEMDGSVSLVNTRTLQTRRLGAHLSQVIRVAFSAGGTLLASGSGDNTVRLWDVGATPQVQQAVEYTEITGFTDWVKSVAFAPDGKFLAMGSIDGQVCLWNVAKREFEWRSPDSRYVEAVAISPDGTLVASANTGFQAPGKPAGIKLRDAATGQVLYHQSAVEAGEISFAPDGSSLATGGSDRVVRLWDLELKKIDELPGQVFPQVYLDRNTAAGSSGSTVLIWDLATRALRDTLKGHSGAVQSLASSGDGKLLASASLDHTVKLWHLDRQSESSVLKGHESDVWSVALSPDGSTVASGSVDRTVKLWDAATGTFKLDLRGHSDDVTCVAYSPDGKTVASSGDDREIILWDTVTGEEKRRLKGHTNTVWSLAFLHGGLTLASTGEDGTVRLWSLATGEGRILVKRPNKFSCLRVWQDQVLALSDWDEYVVELWDLHDRRQRHELRGHQGSVQAVVFVRSGRELATASRDGTVRLWDLESTGPSEILTRHTARIDSLAVSPDGATLACGGGDGTVKLLDLSTRRERVALKGHAGSVLSLVFSQDGKLLVSGGDDHTVRLWRAATDEEVAAAKASSMPPR
jgi:WD40 repeat protein/serine/threonine protein kinase